MPEHDDVERVAIIGMSGVFPGARNISELWDLLCQKQDGISTLTREDLVAAGERADWLDSPSYVPRGGFIDGAEEFDHEFFQISPSEALTIDPQQRLFLTHARLALEDAGQPPETLKSPVGVYAGESPTQYWFLLHEGPQNRGLDDFKMMLGNEKDFLATRTSYKLNLRGPSLDIQSACSTSLAAVGLACQSLLTWNCDLALAGGASVSAPRHRGYLAQEGMIYSPTGVCRPFDAAADGTVFGEGVGVVCLKRLSEAVADGNYIYAVIDAVAMNNDGADKVSFTAPSVNGQAEAIEMAHVFAGVSPDAIGYVETHGTATVLGDPIEVHALTQAFRKQTNRTGYCRIGSIKANIGHLDASAGIVSLIKTALIVNTGLIPPQRNFETPSPHIDLARSPFVVNQELVRWEPVNGRRIAGVSSFGIGGTNVHAIVESPPRPDPRSQAQGPLLLTAKTPEALARYVQTVASWLGGHPDAAPALAEKLRTAHPEYTWRKGWASATDGLSAVLSETAEDFVQAVSGDVVFAFPGQGAQFSAMARVYYGVLPTFSRWIDRGIVLAADLGFSSMRAFLLGDGHEDQIGRTEVTQPLLYIIEYALAQELISRGVKPTHVVGHSIGEYAAAAVAGALSWEDGLRLVLSRGRWMQQAPAGAMVAVTGSPDVVTPFVSEGITISVHNTTVQQVLSGTLEDVNRLEGSLSAAGIEFKRLRTSHAFHSPLMEPILDGFATEVKTVSFSPLAIPFLGNVDGQWRTGAVDWHDYWVRQLRQPVRFDLCLAAVGALGVSRIVEVGPGRALSGFIRLGLPDHDAVFPLLPNPKTEASHFETTLVKLWERGIAVSWPPASSASEMLLFPGYPFAKTRFWPRVEAPVSAPVLGQTPPPSTLRSVWISILGHSDFDDHTSFFLCGADSFAGIQLVQKLKESVGLDLTMAEVMATPTIAGLAARLDGSTATRKSDSPYLLLAQKGGAGPALFMVAGAHQSDWNHPSDLGRNSEDEFFRYFSNLIPNLGADQPLYWFRPKGLGKVEPLHTSVERMAEVFIEAMVAVQPHGPYHLGGECVGGVVAHEMACRLTERGETVASLFLLDTPRPGPWVSLREDFWRMLKTSRWIYRDLLTTLRRLGLWGLWAKVGPWLPSFASFFLPINRWARFQRFCLNANRNYQKILLKHRPRAYSGRVSLIVNRTWNRHRFLLGWGRHLGPQLEVHEVPGAHHNRLLVSGKAIGRIIRETMARRG